MSRAIVVYADGACLGNPGPMGVGAVILDGEIRREISEHIGHGTNNVAELRAVHFAIRDLPRDRVVEVRTDSSYTIGVLSKGWTAKANAGLVGRLRGLVAEFACIRFIKVAGHAGVRENERADALAGAAARKR